MRFSHQEFLRPIPVCYHFAPCEALLNRLSQMVALGLMIAQGLPHYDLRRGDVVLRYTVISSLAAEYSPETVTLNPRKTVAAYVVQTDQGSTVVVGNHVGGTFEEAGGFIFSPDGSRIAYLVRKGTRLYLVLDGRPLGPFTESPIGNFSPDGKRFIVADRVTEYVYTVEGQKLDKFKYVDRQFSQSGERSAFLVRDGTKQAVLLDGIKGPTFEEIYIHARYPEQDQWDLVFSASAKHVAYTAKISGKVCLVIDNEVTGECYQDIIRDSLQIDPDGSRTAYVAVQDGQQFAVVGGHRSTRYDEVLPPLVLSDDWLSLAYAARSARSWRVVFNGTSTRAFDEVSNVVLSPSGKRFAFIGRRNGKEFCVADRVEGSGYDFVLGPRFSPDSRRFACIVRSSGARLSVVLDGRLQRESFPSMTATVFSPDSSRLAIAVRDDEISSPKAGAAHIVLIPNKRTKHFDGILDDTITFSDDSQSLAYVARVYNTRGPQDVVVVDDRVYTPRLELIESKGTPTVSFVPGAGHVVYRIGKQNPSVIMMDGVELSAFACTVPQNSAVQSLVEFYGCRDNSLGKVTIGRPSEVRVSGLHLPEH